MPSGTPGKAPLHSQSVHAHLAWPQSLVVDCSLLEQGQRGGAWPSAVLSGVEALTTCGGVPLSAIRSAFGLCRYLMQIHIDEMKRATGLTVNALAHMSACAPCNGGLLEWETFQATPQPFYHTPYL